MYAGLGLTGIIFAVHGVVEHGWEIQNRRMALTWMMVMACFNFLGAGLYAVRVSQNTAGGAVLFQKVANTIFGTGA